MVTFLFQTMESICIAQPIDGVKILPGKNYTAESLEAAHNEKG